LTNPALVGKLIEGVKKRPILYESTKKAYKDAGTKDDAWKEVRGRRIGRSDWFVLRIFKHALDTCTALK